MIYIEAVKKRWFILIAILIIIILSLNWSDYISLVGGESFSTLRLYELNESVVPQGYTISLTDEDFKEFPQLASIIRERNIGPTLIDQNGTRSYTILFSSKEFNRFFARYWSNVSRSEVDKPFPHRRIFEYKGKYYEYDEPQIH